jgi:hypothetical protein
MDVIYIDYVVYFFFSFAFSCSGSGAGVGNLNVSGLSILPTISTSKLKITYPLQQTPTESKYQNSETPASIPTAQQQPSSSPHHT